MRARLVATAAAAAVLAVVLAGCNFITPQATLKPYDASDGVSTRIGDVTISNALVVTDDGADGNLLFTAVNVGEKPVDLTVQFSSGGDKTTLDLKVDANGSTDFGFGDAGQLFLAGIDTEPGANMPIYFQYGSDAGKQLQVPVLDASLVQYEPYLPTPTPTPTPTLTGTPTPNPTETPAG
ncbi:MAG TPA: DNA modification methylase [Pseudolysinimonas sp.]|nr:DNA modification methylase [Pseudolysinimonas sp.]